MLKGRQKKLDRNKDGKISGEDFKMMKAKYGKMMKAGKGGGADIDYRLGTKMQGNYEGKTLTGKAKEFLGTAAKQTKGSISELRRKVLKKLANSQVSEKEAQEIIKSLPKAKHGKMIKANMGTEVKSTQGYGAARTSGMGLQDEDLIPGKSMDYYKDIV